MEGVTSGAQQIVTWGTGDIVMYLGALGLCVVGCLCYFAGRALMAFLSVVAGIAVASGALGISRSVYGWFHSASTEVPNPNHAFAALEAPPGSSYVVLAKRDGHLSVVQEDRA